MPMKLMKQNKGWSVVAAFRAPVCFISSGLIFYRHRYYTYLLYKWIQPLHPPYRHCFYTFLIYIYRERERSSASGVPLESPINFILINIFEIFLWYSIRMKLIIYEIRAKTMSVTGGVLESLRQVKKQCFFHFTLWLDHSDIIVFLHIYTTNIWHFRIYV